MKDRNKRKAIIYVLVVALMVTTVGYALLEATLNISGTVVKKGSVWSIYFTNLSEPTITGRAEASNASAVASTFDFDVSLYQPGDSISYTVDIKNGGSLDAELSSISLQGVDTANSNNIDFTVEYTDGTPITKGDLLNVDESKTIKITANFMSMTSDGNTNWGEAKVSLGVTLVYVQTEKQSNNNEIVNTGVITKIYGNSIQNGNPSPATPSEIESVGDRTVNILDFEALKVINTTNSAVRGGWEFEIDEDVDITITHDSIGELPVGILMAKKVTDGVYESNIQLTNNVTTISLTSNQKLLVFVGSTNIEGSYNLLANNGITKIQVEKGSTATPYEPYGYKIPITVTGAGTSETVNIYLDEPLRKIGNYADYIDFQSGTIVRNTGKVDLGTLSWSNPTGYSGYMYYTTKLNDMNYKEEGTPLGLCPNYKINPSYAGWADSDKFDGLSINWNTGAIQIRDNRFLNDKDGFTNALNGVNFYYSLMEEGTPENITIPSFPEITGNVSYSVGTKVSPSNIEYDIKS